MDKSFISDIALPYILIAVFTSFIWIPAIHMITCSLYNKWMLDTQVVLPAGAKWSVSMGHEISMLVDVNHGTGDKAHWKTALSFMSHRDVTRRFPSVPSEFVDTSRKGVLNVGRWMREQFINTDGFTTMIPFPVEGGTWDIKHRHVTDIFDVNGFDVESTGFNDQRDVITAMVHAAPKIMKEEQDRLAQERKDQNLKRVLNNVTPTLTTREDKNVSIANTKVQYLSP